MKTSNRLWRRRSTVLWCSMLPGVATARQQNLNTLQLLSISAVTRKYHLQLWTARSIGPSARNMMYQASPPSFISTMARTPPHMKVLAIGKALLNSWLTLQVSCTVNSDVATLFFLGIYYLIIIQYNSTAIFTSFLAILNDYFCWICPLFGLFFN